MQFAYGSVQESVKDTYMKMNFIVKYGWRKTTSDRGSWVYRSQLRSRKATPRETRARGAEEAIGGA